jgi:hypothetical protein
LRSQLKSRLAIFLQVFLGGLKHSERKPS